ncbi:hypothetical protein GW17_00051389 [Ensete ventricosum]|nr:hypothetical protein GW17_00051389 [Ensete ventricosum]
MLRASTVAGRTMAFDVASVLCRAVIRPHMVPKLLSSLHQYLMMPCVRFVLLLWHISRTCTWLAMPMPSRLFLCQVDYTCSRLVSSMLSRLNTCFIMRMAVVKPFG